MRPLNHLVACLMAMVALLGCEDPYAGRSDDPGRAAEVEHAREQRARGDELALPRAALDTAPDDPAGPAPATPRAALERFCAQWANWSWRTIDRQQSRLARLASGRLRRQLGREAAIGRLDLSLRRDRLSVRGRLVAVEVKPGGRPRAAVCVTHEEELQGGRGELGGGRHRVYLARLDRGRQGWGVSAWEPQP